MTNLTSKFDSFEEQLATQHAELMAALGGLGGKLDAIAVALGGAPPTASVTLADVLAAILAGNVTLGDVHTDTMSMDGKLLVLRNTLSDVHIDSQSQDLKLLQIREILSGMDDYLSVPNPVIAQIYASMGSALGANMSIADGYLSSIVTSNAGLLTVLGNPADDTQSILRWVAEIAACACADPNAIPTLNDCISPFESLGMVLLPFAIPGYGDMTVATFPDSLPPGLSFGSVFGLSVDYSELYNADWSGWRIYVQSSEENYAYSPTDLQRRKTNEWQAIPSGPATYSFAVRGQGSIKVILCPTPSIVLDECHTFVVPGDGTNNITAHVVINEASNFRYVNGNVAVGIYPDKITGTAIIPESAFMALTFVGQYSEPPLEGPYPRVIGLCVGMTQGFVTLEVCPVRVFG